MLYKEEQHGFSSEKYGAPSCDRAKTSGRGSERDEFSIALSDARTEKIS